MKKTETKKINRTLVVALVLAALVFYVGVTFENPNEVSLGSHPPVDDIQKAVQALEISEQIKSEIIESLVELSAREKKPSFSNRFYHWFLERIESFNSPIYLGNSCQKDQMARVTSLVGFGEYINGDSKLYFIRTLKKGIESLWVYDTDEFSIAFVDLSKQMKYPMFLVPTAEGTFLKVLGQYIDFIPLQREYFRNSKHDPLFLKNIAIAIQGATAPYVWLGPMIIQGGHALITNPQKDQNSKKVLDGRVLCSSQNESCKLRNSKLGREQFVLDGEDSLGHIKDIFANVGLLTQEQKRHLLSKCKAYTNKKLNTKTEQILRILEYECGLKYQLPKTPIDKIKKVCGQALKIWE